MVTVMEVSSWIISMVHLIQGVCGISFNAILIFLVLKKTPESLASYSILIFNFAICDLVACASALFVQERMICDGLALYLLPQGPCSYFGSLACVIGHGIMLHCFTHGLWSLAFSFLYRYYILGHEQPKNSTIISVIALIYTPSFLQLALTVQATLPILYLAASSIYVAELLCSYRDQFFEYLVPILLNFIPMLTPLTSLYFIGPYRTMICDGLAIYLLSQGPCSHFGPLACIIGHSVMIHCFTHGLWSLAFSFFYRYYILGHEQPKNSTIISIIALIYTLSFLQL
ncbi:hypothetical protein GCK32_010116, partial [Trichostrongylus colubriformis]